MTSPIQIRNAVASDGEACGSVVYEAFSALAEHHRFPPDFPSTDAATALVGDILASPMVEGFVAERDGRVVGCIFIDLAHPVADIGPIAVSPSAQERGLGRQLMRAALDCAETACMTNVRLIQTAYNNASLSLYLKLGFRARTLLSAVQGPIPARRIEGRHVRPAEEAHVHVAISSAGRWSGSSGPVICARRSLEERR